MSAILDPVQSLEASRSNDSASLPAASNALGKAKTCRLAALLPIISLSHHRRNLIHVTNDVLSRGYIR